MKYRRTNRASTPSGCSSAIAWGDGGDLTPSELASVYALDFLDDMGTDCLAWSSETDCALGSTAEDGAANICQWDPSQPNGRKCSVKSVIFSMIEDYLSCVVFTVPSSASDCTAVAPWCVYEMYDGSPRCYARRNVHNTDGSFEFAMREAYNAAPFVVVPPPPPPPPPPQPSSSPGSSRAFVTHAWSSVMALCVGMVAL